MLSNSLIKNMKIESIVGDYKSFLEKIFQNLEKAGFSVGEFKELDHIAYRTETIERYEEIKKELIELSEASSDKVFNGRRILICRLKTPLVYDDFSIEGIEVLAPKENNRFKEGLEHAEFVTKISLPEFKERHGDIDFDLRAYDREDNPELVIEFEKCAAKFHEQSLLEVREI